MRNSITNLALASILLTFSSYGYAKDWEHTLGTYLLTLNLDGDSAVNTPGGVVVTPIDLDFEDLLEHLGKVGVIYYQVKKGPWSIDIDLTHAELEGDDSVSVPVPPPLGPATATINAEITIDEYEGFGGYRFHQGQDSETQFIFGARYYKHDIDIAVLAGPVGFSPAINSSWVDPFLGVRYQQKINNKWNWHARGDVGGFGVGSDLSYKIELGASYDINEKWMTGFGVRYLAIDYEDGNPADADYYTFDGKEYGLLLGIAYKF